MTKTIKASIIAITLMITAVIGYKLGFNHCQKMWEHKTIEQIKRI
jgi:hypothetical protein|tara:strand:+ start:446 stop:580 length:135 start_codon:yes stop_codon:yes gene_type:complete